jgi:hypothetical protein
MGARPTEVFQEAVRGGIVSEIAKVGSMARSYENVEPRDSNRSSIPEA